MMDGGFRDLAERIRRLTRADHAVPNLAACDACSLDHNIRKIFKELDNVADHMTLALERQSLHESLIANSSDAIVIKTLNGTITGWNPAATEVFGYTEAEMIGQPIGPLIPEDRLEEEREILAKISRGEPIQNYQTVRRRKNGELFPVAVTLSPIRDTAGTVIGASKIARDISEAMRAADALKRAEERYELVLQGTSLGIWDRDVKNNHMFLSPRLRSIVGTWSFDEANLQDSFIARVHPDDRQKVENRLRAHLQDRSNFDMEYRLRVSRGEYVWIHASRKTVWDEHGTITRMAGSVEDISARKRLENELLEMVEKLKKTNKDLDEFAYAASHDLKAPLRVIDNASQWLMEDLEPHLTPDTRDNMALLRNRVGRMEKLLDDLLEYSRIGRTQDERFRELVTGCDLLENILSLLSPKPGFTVRADAGFAAMKVTRMPLQQVLMNLIGNAIKHHDKPAGTISLDVQDEGHMVAFTVTDDGPGISEQFHEKIFEMFRTLKPRDQVEGSGMGLAMVRKNVEMLGGAIALDSNPGQGCKFRFTWPKSQFVSQVEA